MISLDSPFQDFLSELAVQSEIALDTEADSLHCYFEKLCSIIAKEELATIAFDEDDIFTWYELTSNNELPIQDDYVLKKYNKRQNKFFDQY